MENDSKVRTADKPVTSVRLTPTGQRLWGELAAKMGLSKTGVMETLLRDRAKIEGLAVDGQSVAIAEAES